MAAAAGKYIDAAALELRLTTETYVQMFDDQNTGDRANVDDAAVQQVIDSAEGEVDSYLITIRAQPLPATLNPTVDRLVKTAALDFAESLCFQRHPEYVRQYGTKPNADGLWERAKDRMMRVRQGIQELPDVDKQAGKPITIGGLVYDEGPRTIVTSADGTENGSGF